MSSIGPISTALVLFLLPNIVSPSVLYAQTRAPVKYFAAFTLAGRPTARPYASCERVQVRSRTLWACPLATLRSDTGERNRSGSDMGGMSNSGSSSGSSGNGGMGGSDGNGGMGGSGNGSMGN